MHNSVSTTHPWGIPVTILEPTGGDIPIIPFTELKFNPVGLYHLRRWQGVFPRVPGLYATHQARFDAADLAWFAHGMHRDGNHNHALQAFHPMLVDFYRTSSKEDRKALMTRLQALAYDVVCYIWL